MQDNDWSPSSWQKKRLDQPVVYPDAARLESVLAKLAKLPPLVTSWEVETLKRQLSEASRGERFLLQGGDCSESFDDCESPSITRKLKILLQMSFVLVYGSKKRLIRVGRFAGQYAKPRSSLFETRDRQTLPSYRGDIINRVGFTEEERTPNPDLLLAGYQYAALTLNYIRGLVEGGFADLHHPGVLGSRVRPSFPTGRRVQGDRRSHRRFDPLHGDDYELADRRDEPHRLLYQP